MLEAYRGAVWTLLGNGDPAAIPLEVTESGKVLLAHSAVDGSIIGAGNTSSLLDALAYVAGGVLRICGGSGGDRVLNNDAGKTWLSVYPAQGSAMALYQDAGGTKHLVRVSYATGQLFPDGEITLVTNDGQSNAEAQSGTSSLALMAAYPWPDRLRMPNLGVRLGLVTSGGASLPLDPALFTGFKPLADAIEVTHGTTSVASAAHAYSKAAAAVCGGWTPKMLVWGNAEGGQSIANLLNNAPAGKYAFSNIVAALTKAVALLGAEGNRLVSRWMFMAQTESDAGDTALGLKHDLYRSQVEAAAKPITGQPYPVRMLTAQMSNFFASSVGVANRSLLAYAVANEVQGGTFWCLGPTYAYPWSDDYLHHTSIGHQMRGDLEAAAALSVEKTGFWRPLRMVSASITGTNQITVTLSEAAINDESAGVAPIANKGIVVPGRTVTAVAVAGAAMTITTGEAAAGATVVQSALIGHDTTRGQATIPRSTIRSVASYGVHATGAANRKWLSHQEISLS